MKILILLSFLFIFACANEDPNNEQEAQTIVLTLDNVSSSLETNDVWTEENIPLRFVNTTAEDCGSGNSTFGVAPKFVWLYPQDYR